MEKKNRERAGLAYIPVSEINRYSDKGIGLIVGGLIAGFYFYLAH